MKVITAALLSFLRLTGYAGVWGYERYCIAAEIAEQYLKPQRKSVSLRPRHRLKMTSSLA